MNWIRQARRGAADEFGRRMWRWFLAAAIVRRAVLPLLMLAALAIATGIAIRWSVWWLPRLASLALAAATFTAVAWAFYIGAVIHHRLRWRPAPHTAIPVALALLTAGAGALFWLR
ncbi:hypothetical protein [Catenuloplanes japonicus]|uniref:hypothetical protein n=1 Tax=Catenuloplanes japonicus TaxID=33876 RepID=UPI0005265972|nr:hypothetical protein [Catenuloplanes japonicus]